MQFKLRLALSGNVEAELKRVTDFYAKNASDYVRERDPEILRAAIHRASVLLLEDEHGKLLACCVQIDHGAGLYSETGGVRVLLNGYGLQAIMMGICSLNEYIFSPPGEFIFAITADDNSRSIKNINRAGFVADTPDRSLLDAIGYTAEFPDTKRFFKFDWASTPPIRRRLLTLASTGELSNGSSTIKLSVHHPLFRPANLKLIETS